jgi:hypothetical protein
MHGLLHSVGNSREQRSITLDINGSDRHSLRERRFCCMEIIRLFEAFNPG